MVGVMGIQDVRDVTLIRHARLRQNRVSRARGRAPAPGAHERAGWRCDHFVLTIVLRPIGLAP